MHVLHHTRLSSTVHRLGNPEAAHRYSSRSDRDSCQACNLANSFLSLPHVTVSDRAGMFGLFLSGACRLCPCGWLLLQSYHFNSLVAAVGLWRTALMSICYTIWPSSPRVSLLTQCCLNNFFSRLLPFILRKNLILISDIAPSKLGNEIFNAFQLASRLRFLSVLTVSSAASMRETQGCCETLLASQYTP